MSIFSAGSEASIILENILLDKRVIADVRQLSPMYQTSTLEAKHSLDVRFAPKNQSFSYLGMQTRYFFYSVFSSAYYECFPFISTVDSKYSGLNSILIQ